jgi:hypothetical protein
LARIKSSPAKLPLPFIRCANPPSRFFGLPPSQKDLDLFYHFWASTVREQTVIVPRNALLSLDKVKIVDCQAKQKTQTHENKLIWQRPARFV